MMPDGESVSASISQESESSDLLRGESDESKSSEETFSNPCRGANADPSLRLGAQETRIVRKSKVCVYIFLLLAAIIGSLSTWYFLNAVEQQSFAHQVRSDLADSTKTDFCSPFLTDCRFVPP